jgi:hypothetical protein
LRHLRDDLSNAAGLRRESLVLDLGGHHGFLTWEALRRCVEGGVWTRCENAEEEAELEAWIRRVDPLHRPVPCVSPLESLPVALGTAGEPPRFDAILGLGVAPPSLEWMNALRSVAAPSATWALAFRRTGGEIPWEEWLSGASSALRDDVTRLVARQPPRQEPSTGEGWEALLRDVAGWRVRREIHRYEDRRRLTPTQARDWLTRVSVDQAALAPLRAALEPAEWDAVAAAAAAYLSGGLRSFPAAFDVLVAESAGT